MIGVWASTVAWAAPAWELRGDASHEYGQVVEALELTGDAYPDVVVTRYDPTTQRSWVELYPSGPGGPASVPSWTAEVGTTSVILRSGDVDGDGRPDLIVGDATFGRTVPGTTQGRLQVYRGTAAGLVLGATVDGQPSESIATDVLVADVDLDGIDDVVYTGPGWANNPPGGMWWIRGGTQSAPVQLLQGGQIQCAGAARIQTYNELSPAADVDGDGRIDFLVANTGACTAGTWVTWSAAPGGPVQTGTFVAGYDLVDTGDVNGDGHPDLLGHLETQEGYYGLQGRVKLAWFLGDVGPLDPVPAWTWTSALAGRGTAASAGDFDGDGFTDVVASRTSIQPGGQILGFAGAAALPGAAPTASAVYPVAGSAFGTDLAVGGDLDQDGYADLLVTGVRGHGLVRMYPGHP